MKLSNTKASYYASLNQSKHRKSEGLFLICGRKCVVDTAGCFDIEVLITDSSISDDYGLDCKELLTASPAQLSRISRMESAPEVVAVCRIPDYQEDEDYVRNNLSLVLDDVQNPGNLGTIVRAADWFGIRYVFASEGTADIFSPKAVQATMGALARVRVIYCDIPDLLSRYAGLPVYATLLDGDNIYDAHLEGKGLIVMGNEGRGISPEVRHLVNSGLKIPSYPPDAPACESLNVGIATSIVLAEFRRRML